MPKLQIDLVVDDKGSLVFTGFGKEVDRVMWSGGKAVKSFGKQVAIGGVALTAFATATGLVLAKLIGVADRYTLIEGRLKLVTDGSEQLSRVQERLYRTSLDTHQGFEATATLYTGLARSTKELAISEDRLIGITTSLNQAMLVSGASQDASADSMRQLNQAMFGGVVRAEEFNSIMDNTPRVLEAVADGMDKTMGELRNIMLDGKLDAKLFLESFEKGAVNIAREFSEMKTTVSQALGDLRTVFESIIDGANDSSGATDDIATSIQDLTKTIDENRDQITSFFSSMVKGASGTVSMLGNVYRSIQALGIVAASEDKSLIDWVLGNPEDMKNWQTEILSGVAFLKDDLVKVRNRITDVQDSWGSLKDKTPKLEALRVEEQELIDAIAERRKKYEEAAKAATDGAEVVKQTNNAISTNAIAATTASTKAMLSLEESLADKVNRLSLSKYHYAVQKLDDEVAKMQEVAGTNKTIQDQIASYHKLKIDEIGEQASLADISLSKDRADANRALYAVLNDNAEGHYVLEKQLLDERFANYRLLLGDSLELEKAYQLELDEIGEQASLADISLSKDRADANRELYEILNDNAEGHYVLEKQLLDERFANYRLLLGDSLELEKAYQLELDKLSDQRLLKEGSLVDGMGVALDRLTKKRKTAGEIGAGLMTDYYKLAESTSEKYLSAFIRGEEVKIDVAGAAADILAKYAVKAATTGLTEIFSAIGGQIGAWVGLGTAQAGVDGKTWQQKLASGAAYLAGAGVSVLAGKAIGNSFHAEGGWIGSHPGGGMLHGGSGVADDLFLGYTDNGMTRNWGMGGEFVMDKETTRHNYDLLEFMRGQKKKVFAEGGPVGDAMGVTRDINDSGFDTFVSTVIDTKGNWKQGIVNAILYYGGTAAGMMGGKALGKNLFESGGQVKDKGYGFGGWFEDVLDPAGVFHDVEDTTFYDVWAGGDPGTSTIFNQLLPLFGGNEAVSPLEQLLGEKVPIDWGNLWNVLRNWPGIDKSVESLDNQLYPYVRDMLTPGGNPSWSSVQDSLSSIFTSIGKEIQGYKDTFSADGGMISGFAAGGDHQGGLRMVGENGPELEFTAPSKIYSNSESKNMLAAGSSEVVEELRKLRTDIIALNSAVAENTRKTTKMLVQFSKVGMPVRVLQ